MAHDQQTLKAFLSDTRTRAADVLDQPHVGADVKNVIRDLLQISDSFYSLLDQSAGQSADARVLKKKLDLAKTEMREVANKLEATKKTMMALVEEIKTVNTEVAQIVKRHEATPQDLDIQSALRIKAVVQKMVGHIVQLGG